MLGSAVIKGKATEVIDVGHFLPIAFEDWLLRKEMPRHAGGHTLLLVDDSPFFRNMLPPVLQAAGYRVVIAASAEEGLSILRKRHDFDAVLCDLDMPGMDGKQLLAEMKSDERLAGLSVIALAPHATSAEVAKLQAAGFRDFVAKFDRPGLIAALKETTITWGEAA